ncbi:hypothetical protein FZW96_07875 [Bacillus sp. BGMRC 2118]|nr:hypothetical protein FZW96_07875 [Bacillus sp. BGMRC 2118]
MKQAVRYLLFIVLIFSTVVPSQMVQAEEGNTRTYIDFQPHDSVLDPVNSIIYMTKLGSKTLYAVNYKTGDIQTLALPHPTERLELYEDKLYVTQHKMSHDSSNRGPYIGAIAEISLEDFSITKVFDVEADPFDIAVVDHHIYITPGSGYGGDLVVYSLEDYKKVIQEVRRPYISEQSYVYSNPVMSKVYALEIETGARELEAIEIVNGTVMNQYYLPNYWDYGLLPSGEITPDGLSMYNTNGDVFELAMYQSGDMVHDFKLPGTYNDFAFNLEKQVTYAADDNGTVHVYKYNTDEYIYSTHTHLNVKQLLYQHDLVAIGITGSGKYFVEDLGQGEKDVTPPSKPVIAEVTDKANTVTGQAEPRSTIEVTVDDAQIGTGTTDENGDFTVTIPIQKSGTILQVTSTDLGGNVSEAVSVVVTDTTAPARPYVYLVADYDTSVKGKAEAGSTVEVKVNETKIGTGTTDEDGRFVVTIPTQKAESILHVSSTDLAGNISEIVSVTVTDRTPPSNPVVHEVTDKDEFVTGKAEAWSMVHVIVDGLKIGNATSNSNGNFAVSIPVQKAGTTLYVTATDKAGNTSRESNRKVTDVTAPEKPRVGEVTDQARFVEGSAEGGSTVRVKVDGNVIGTGIAYSSGRFEVSIPMQKAGTTLYMTSTDLAGNISESESVVVIDKTPPADPIVNEVTEETRSVTGKAEAGSTIEVRVKIDGVVIGTSTTTSEGDFYVPIPVQPLGTTLYITSTDSVGNVSKIVTVVVVDKTAPMKPVVNEVTDEVSQVRGQAEAGSRVEVKVNEKVIGSNTTHADGTFVINIPLQQPGTILTISSTDAAGNKSEISMTVRGIKKSGWAYLNETWYYYDTNSKVKTGWLYDRAWYYLDQDGKMQTGWIWDGAWYYLNPGGDMKTGWLYKHGTYYLSPSGAMQTGWVQLGSTWYFFERNGNMKTGWLNDRGTWYYLYPISGKMAVNTMIGSYKIGPTGAWIH